jgi:hypothetical protein
VCYFPLSLSILISTGELTTRSARLICSDLIARGIDLPHVSHVISYDIPADMRKYVHRVGRTARAGKTGDAWSLVEDQEVRPASPLLPSLSILFLFLSFFLCSFASVESGLTTALRQAAPFKAIMASAQHLQKISRVRVKDSLVEPFVPAYQVSIPHFFNVVMRAHHSSCSGGSRTPSGSLRDGTRQDGRGLMQL